MLDTLDVGRVYVGTKLEVTGRVHVRQLDVDVGRSTRWKLDVVRSTVGLDVGTLDVRILDVGPSDLLRTFGRWTLDISRWRFVCWTLDGRR